MCVCNIYYTRTFIYSINRKFLMYLLLALDYLECFPYTSQWMTFKMIVHQNELINIKIREFHSSVV